MSLWLVNPTNIFNLYTVFSQVEMGTHGVAIRWENGQTWQVWFDLRISRIYLISQSE